MSDIWSKFSKTDFGQLSSFVRKMLPQFFPECKVCPVRDRLKIVHVAVFKMSNQLKSIKEELAKTTCDLRTLKG